MYQFHVKIYIRSQLVYSGCEWVLSSCAASAKTKLFAVLQIRHGVFKSVIWQLSN